MNYYKQCRFTKIVPDKDVKEPRDWSGAWKTVEETSWIPEQFAHVGNYIKLKNADGTWSDGWTIRDVYQVRLDEETVLSNSQLYKHHREGSDI